MSASTSDGILVLGTKRYSSWSMRGWLIVRMAGIEVGERVIPLGAGATPAIAAVSPSGLVPYLEHDGNQLWDSLAIAEYCAERAPGLWPAAPDARCRARVLAAEMHAGFRALRQAMPMNLGRDRPLAGGIPADVQADIDRVARLWRETRARWGAGGDYLFGAGFTIADAMFAPVVARFRGYRVPLGVQEATYCEAVRGQALVARWHDEAAAEPVSWRLDRYEDVP